MSLYTVTGTAVPGKRLGTRLGFPTANLSYTPGQNPLPNGVYIAVAETRGRRWAAVLNQGTHPTSPDGAPTIEAHLLDFPHDELYGETLTLRYERFLRPERHFPSLEALRAQLALDRDAARDWARANAPSLLDPKENA